MPPRNLNMIDLRRYKKVCISVAVILANPKPYEIANEVLQSAYEHIFTSSSFGHGPTGGRADCTPCTQSYSELRRH